MEKSGFLPVSMGVLKIKKEFCHLLYSWEFCSHYYTPAQKLEKVGQNFIKH